MWPLGNISLTFILLSSPELTVHSASVFAYPTESSTQAMEAKYPKLELPKPAKLPKPQGLKAPKIPKPFVVRSESAEFDAFKGPKLPKVEGLKLPKEPKLPKVGPITLLC